jgi:putative hydrolase of the HAD superfamily
MTKLKAILFDLDNTLLDFYTLKMSAIDAALVAMKNSGLKSNMEVVRNELNALFKMHGWEHQQIFQLLLEKIKESNPKILAAGIVAYRKEKAKHVQTYPQVVPTLNEIKKRGYKIGIVTDADTLQGWIRLTELGLENMFDAVVTRDSDGVRKPHALPFQKALAKLNVKPSETLHVGDWPARDIAGAKALGLKTALAKYGMSEVLKDESIVPDFTLNKFEDLLEIAL